MRLSLIAAMSQNRVIGKDNQLPWHLSDDLKRFRKITGTSPIIMGRKTHESIGRLLPNRENVILTRQRGYRLDGATVFHTLDEAIATLSQRCDEAFIIGGAELYQQAMDRVDRVYLTLIHRTFDGDAYLPLLPRVFVEVEREDHMDADLPHSFIVMDRSAS